VRDGIDARAGRYHARLGQSQPRIKNGNARGGFCIQAGHFLMSVLVHYERSRLALAACAGGGWNGNKRQHRFASFVCAPVILNATAIAEEKVAAFCRVHGAAAAEGDENINPALPCDRDAFLDATGGRIFFGAVEHSHLQALGLENLDGAGGMSSGNNAGICYEKYGGLGRARPCYEIASEFTEPLKAVDAEDEARARRMIERREGGKLGKVSVGTGRFTGWHERMMRDL
jgi:hypothetical protein